MILEGFLGLVVAGIVFIGVVPSYYNWIQRKWRMSKDTHIVLVTYAKEGEKVSGILRVSNKGLDELRNSRHITVEVLNGYRSTDWGVYY